MADSGDMQAIKLEDVFPEQPEFRLKKTGKTYRLRLPTLDDQMWIRRTFKSDQELNRIMAELDWISLTKIIYRHLEDKSDFMAQDAKIINDEGETANIRLTGPEVLLNSVVGTEEAMQMLGAWNKAVALSSPLVDEHLRTELKKNFLEMKLTGEKSLISSHPSMDGQPSTSSPER